MLIKVMTDDSLVIDYPICFTGNFVQITSPALLLSKLRNMVYLLQQFELNHTNYDSIESRDAIKFSQYITDKRNIFDCNYHMFVGRQFSDISFIVKLWLPWKINHYITLSEISFIKWVGQTLEEHWEIIWHCRILSNY